MSGFLKKFFIVTLICITFLGGSVPVLASDNVGNYDSDYIQEYIVTHQAELEKSIEENLDALHKKISDYQKQQPQLRGISYGGFNYLDGDIIVTRSTSSAGLTGHAGIVVGNGVLEITPNYNGGTPACVSFSTWFKRYPTAMVMRYTNGRTIPVNAAWYGQTYYIDGAGKNHKYNLAGTIGSTTSDYCSSLVWKCYDNGAGLAFETYYNGYYSIPPIILPYDFINVGAHNGFSAVNSVNW